LALAQVAAYRASPLPTQRGAGSTETPTQSLRHQAMASPFRTFRKNQKAWMVGLTIMTMFAFVFLGQVAGNRSSDSGEYKDP